MDLHCAGVGLVTDLSQSYSSSIRTTVAALWAGAGELPLTIKIGDDYTASLSKPARSAEYISTNIKVLANLICSIYQDSFE